jgi:hypothetical protein
MVNGADVQAVLGTRLPVWLGLLAMLLSGGGAIIGTATFGNYRWNENNESRFAASSRRFANVDRRLSTLEVALAGKVSDSTRRDMLRSLERLLDELRANVNALEGLHMNSQNRWTDPN